MFFALLGLKPTPPSSAEGARLRATLGPLYKSEEERAGRQVYGEKESRHARHQARPRGGARHTRLRRAARGRFGLSRVAFHAGQVALLEVGEAGRPTSPSPARPRTTSWSSSARRRATRRRALSTRRSRAAAAVWSRSPATASTSRRRGSRPRLRRDWGRAWRPALGAPLGAAARRSTGRSSSSTARARPKILLPRRGGDVEGRGVEHAPGHLAPRRLRVVGSARHVQSLLDNVLPRAPTPWPLVCGSAR